MRPTPQPVRHTPPHRQSMGPWPDPLPLGGTLIELLGVTYLHVPTSDGGDLYVTRHGLPRIECLLPENWYEKNWFRKHREPLRGTSTIYRVRTRKINGRGAELVVKWSRMGQDVPLETKVIEDILNAEFNSPFEEFALVEEMRQGRNGPRDLRLLTHRPMSIYVPPERLQLWQTGRVKYKIQNKVRSHSGVELDILRQYILMYEWVEGRDASEIYSELDIPNQELYRLTWRAQEEMRAKGFFVADMKSNHIIVRKNANGEVLRRRGKIVYALVDFELLQRTAEHEAKVKSAKRKDYLSRQRERFARVPLDSIPPHLKAVNVLGVDYIYGHVESTGGQLWVVGHDPTLYDYFQPERWRKTPREKLSETHHVYYTKTKDNINLVWKSSRVGELPDVDDSKWGRRILEHGYNSPFEEFAHALELSRRGVAITYPRAIYMTGPQSKGDERTLDRRRFEHHRDLVDPKGRPFLREDRDYIKLWGYFNGMDATLSAPDDSLVRSISVDNAYRAGLLTPDQIEAIIELERQVLADAGFVSLNLTSHHLMLTLRGNRIINDDHGHPRLRLCNFELLSPLGATDGLDATTAPTEPSPTPPRAKN